MLVLLLVAFISFLARPSPLTFDVTLVTERIAFETSQAPTSRIVLDSVEVWTFEASEPRLASGTFEMAANASVVVERVGMGGMSVQVSSSGGASAGRFYDTAGRPAESAGSFVELFIPDPAARARAGANSIVPVAGLVVPGRDLTYAAPGTSAILRSGTVTLLGRSIFWWLTPAVFNAGAVELKTGDTFVVEDPRTDAFGFAVANDQPALTAAYRVVAGRGYVVRSGPSADGVIGYPVYVSFFSRLVRDPLTRALSVLMGLFLAVVTVSGFWLDWRVYRRESRRPDASASDPKGQGTLLLLVCLVLSPGVSPVSAQEGVHVRAGSDEGRGVLRARQLECFVVTPGHVVEKAPEDLVVTTSDGARWEADLEALYEPDLAVLRVPRLGACDEWNVPEGFDGFLRQYLAGVLEIPAPTGGSGALGVQFRFQDAEVVVVRPSDARDEIAKMMSGSSLFVLDQGKKVFAGMLLNLSEAQADEGVILQADNMIRILDAFFPVAGPRMEFAEAQAVLERAVQSRATGEQGQTVAVQSLIAQGVSFQDADLSGLSLESADLRAGSFQGALLAAAKWSEVNAEGVVLSGADLRFADLERANLSRADATEVYAPFVVGQGAVLAGATLARANFAGSDLRKADLRGANLAGAALVYADLRGADLSGADLSGAYLTGSLLQGATFTDAVVRETDFAGASASGLALSPEQFSGACWHEGVVNGRTGKTEFRVQLIEVWESTRSSTGYDTELHYQPTRQLGGHGARTLRACSSSTDAAVRHDARWGAELRIHLDRSYSRTGGRLEQFERRVAAQGELLETHLSRDSVLVDPSVVESRREALHRAMSAAQPLQPFLSDEYLLMLALSKRVLAADTLDWGWLLRMRLNDEGNISTFSPEMYPPVFPEGLSYWAFPAGSDTRYREWTMTRAANLPDFAVDVRYFPSSVDDSGHVHLRSGSLNVQDTRVLARAGIEPDSALRVGLNVPYLGRAFLVLPESVRSYAFSPPEQALEVPEDQAESTSEPRRTSELTYEIREVQLVEGGFLLFVSPREARLVEAGVVRWEGPIVASAH